MSILSRTEQIAAAVLHVLDQHQPWLDAMPSLRSLVLDVKMNQKTGAPRVVILRPETESDADYLTATEKAA